MKPLAAWWVCATLVLPGETYAAGFGIDVGTAVTRSRTQ